MKKLLTGALGALLAAAIGLGGTAYALGGLMPSYPLSLGNDNATEKITGRYLVETAAASPVTITIYGSSELRTFEVPTHPSNFFAGERAGFQINLVGRGSCQSLIHALSIAACGDALAGTKVVLITSPQSYVEGGIAPDLFMANFSEEQYLALMRDPDIPEEMKQRFSARVDELFDEMASLKKCGFNIMMDDFGSGYSSLNMLRNAPVDTLKIDRFFLDEIMSTDRGKIIVEASVRMAKQLGLNVIAEGVETQDQLNFLKTIGCDIVQGYYYSRPIPVGEFESFMEKNR